MKTNRTINRCSLLALGALTCTMVGCSIGESGHHAGNISMIRDDPSPAMHTLARRAADRNNDIAVSKDTNLRMLVNDIDKHLLYIDRPSHLTKFPSKH